eukprot:1130297-Rhodomonas_salina.4
MSGTELRYGATRLSQPRARSLPVQLPYLLRSPYAMSGTERAVWYCYFTTRSPFQCVTKHILDSMTGCSPLPATRKCYAVPGTDLYVCATSDLTTVIGDDFGNYAFPGESTMALRVSA